MLYQMNRHQHEDTRNMKENVTSPEENDDSPEIDPNSKEIYEVPEKNSNYDPKEVQ